MSGLERDAKWYKSTQTRFQVRVDTHNADHQPV